MRRREFITLHSASATWPLGALAQQAAQAEISGGVVKLGVTDETGVWSAPSGEGSIEATRMAVEDFGSKAAAEPIEIIQAGCARRGYSCSGLIAVEAAGH